MTKEKKVKNEGGEVMKKESKRTKKTFHNHSARIYLTREKNQATHVGNFRERKPVL